MNASKLLLQQTSPSHPLSPRSTNYHLPQILSLLPPLPIHAPTPNQPLLPLEHQPRLLLLHPRDRLLQIRIIPRQLPQPFLDSPSQIVDLRVIFSLDVVLREPGFVARAGAAGEGQV